SGIARWRRDKQPSDLHVTHGAKLVAHCQIWPTRVTLDPPIGRAWRASRARDARFPLDFPSRAASFERLSLAAERRGDRLSRSRDISRCLFDDIAPSLKTIFN
ncbi:hypothetical protein ALC62_11010, partial [Cyphomyrmex costatus]